MAKISREELDRIFGEARTDHPASRSSMVIRRHTALRTVPEDQSSTFHRSPGKATWSFPVPVRFRNQIKETQDAEQ